MPAPLLAAGIAGGATVLGSGINAWQTGRMNKKSMQFAREMYSRQYADNLALWNMQNEYNSPAAQMQRFKDAGLNPNLIYGQQNTAGPLTSPDVQKPQFDAPQYGNAISGGALATIDAMYNLEMKQAQTDNLKLQADVIKQEAALKGVQTKRGIFDLGLESELRSTSVDARKEALRQLKVNIDLSLRKDFREQIMMSSNLREASERIQNLVAQRQSMLLQNAHSVEDRKRIMAETARIKKQIQLMSQEGVIKQLDANLAKEGIRPGDPLWYRVITQGFNSVYDFFFGDE